MNTKTIVRERYVIREPLLIAHDEPLSPYSDIGLWSSEREQFSSAGILERYYTDLYKRLLAALVSFDLHPVTTKAESTALQSLLTELITVKSLLQNESTNN